MVLLGKTVYFPCVLEDVMMESARHHKVLMRDLLDPFVRESPVDLLACTRSGDVVVYLDNFTFPLAL